MKNLVRFSIGEIQYPGNDWLLAYNQLNERVRALLPDLHEAVNHPWHDRSKYVIYDNASDDQIGVFQQIANEQHISFQYPCHRDISAFGDGGKWHYAE